MKRVTLSIPAGKTQVSISAPASDGRVRVSLRTRSPLANVGHDRIVKAIQEKGIETCGVAHNEMGRYFDIIPPTRGKPRQKDTDDKPVKPLADLVLEALPAIYGKHHVFELLTS